MAADRQIHACFGCGLGAGLGAGSEWSVVGAYLTGLALRGVEWSGVKGIGFEMERGGKMEWSGRSGQHDSDTMTATTARYKMNFDN